MLLEDDENPRVYPAPSIKSPVTPDIVNTLERDPAADKVMSFANTI